MVGQTIGLRSLVRWGAMLVSAIWMIATLYVEFFDADPTAYGFRSPEVEAAMNGCNGRFQKRYDCKEAIIIAKGYESFAIWVEKGLLILGPPLLTLYLVDRWSRRPEERQRRRAHRRARRAAASVNKYRVR